MKFTSVIVLALAGFVAAADKGEAEGHSKHGNGTKAVTTKSQCKQVNKLTQITDLAANTTKLAEKADNNATLIAEFQAKAAKAKTTLDTLKTNATLIAACNAIFAEEDMQDSCDQMYELEAANQIINNATLLAEFTENNTTKADKFKAKVAKASAALPALQSNATLTAFCAAEQDKSTCKAMAKVAKHQALAANTTALVSYPPTLYPHFANTI